MHIFVFGSNRLGIHKRGAALYALNNRGAILGQGEGLQGQSYALPTKATPWQSLTLAEVKEHVDRFLAFASNHPELLFQVTKIGCGLAGFTEEQIAPLFLLAPWNCQLPEGWW